MAYGKYRRTMRRGVRSVAGRRTRPARKKAPSVTVRRATRVKVAPKAAVTRNTRMIRSLKMSQYGSVQKCCVVGSHICTPTSSQPLLIDLSDFTREYSPPEYDHNAHGGYIYSLDAAGVLSLPAHWIIPPLANVSTSPFQSFNNDIVDGGKYLAMSNFLTVKLEGRPQVSNVRVRFQVFTQNMKAFYAHRTGVPQPTAMMPDALIHLKNLATFTSGNFLPKKFFHCTYDKTVFLNSASVPSQGQHGTTANVKYVSIPWKPPGGKLVRQRISAPTNNTGATNLPEPARGYFGPDTRNPGELQWLLISTDDTAATTPAVQVTFKSMRTWRDAQGSY